MTCGCHKRKREEVDMAAVNPAVSAPSEGTAPTDACALCAEKHLSTAYALACESFYENENRQRIIGELTAASWHVYRLDKALALSVREARHAIQERREAEVDWKPMLAAVDALAGKEVAELNRNNEHE